MTAREDWISAVEAAYRLELSEDDWTQHVADTIAPWRNAGFGVLCYFYDATDEALGMRSVAVSGVPAEIAPGLIDSLRSSPPEAYLPLLLSTRPYGTISTIPGTEPTLELMHRTMGSAGMRDSYGLVARTRWNRGLVVGVNLPERRVLPEAEIGRLASTAAHLEAALRLRQALTEEVSLDNDDVEAVLTPDGRIVHATGDAAPRSARDELRDAALRIDRARGAVRRRDPDESLALWQGMVDGRWSLVDHFDHDGRRFVVARRNQAGIDDPRSLTERETQVAHQVGLGKTNAEAAYALGLAENTVRNHLSTAMAKLGLSRRIQLVRMASAPFREALTDLGAGELVVRSTRLTLGDDEQPPDATPAEAEVLRLVAEGLTNREIAHRRGVSERTVANQVAALLRKYDAGTREELVRRVTGS